MPVKPSMFDFKYQGLSSKEAMRQSERDALLWEQKEAQKEANEIARQRLYEERQYRLECELREEAIREAERENERAEICNTLGLDYNLIRELNNIEYIDNKDLEWYLEQYLKGEINVIDEIFIDTGTTEIFDKINNNIKKLKRKQSMKNFKSFYLIPSLISVALIGILLFMIYEFADEGIISAFIMLVAWCIIGIDAFLFNRIAKKLKKQPRLEDRELEKIKTFLQDYIKAGEIAMDKFKQYKSKNPNVVFDSIFENVIYKDLSSEKQEKTSRVQRIKSEDKLFDEATEKINKGQGKEYNLAMAKILDEYEQDVDRIVDRFSTQSDIVEEQQLNNTTYCPECGNEVDVGEKYCGKCGNKI